MSFFTRSHQPPNTAKATTEKGPPPDGPPEHAPADTAAGDGTGTGEEATAGDTTPDTTADAGNDTADGATDNRPDATEITDAADATDSPQDDHADDEPTTPDADTAGDTAGDAPEAAVAGGGWRERYPQAARTVAWGTTALAAALVLFALLLPNKLTLLTPSAFVRIPVEVVIGAAALLVLPPQARTRQALTVLAGVGLGLLTILKCLDMGFYSVLDRPFDLVLDWILFDDAESFLKDSIGPTGAIGALIGVVLLVLALLVLMTLAALRLSRLMVQHRATAIRTTLVLGTAWITCAALGMHVGGVPTASRSTVKLLQHRKHQVSAGLKDGRTFAKKAAVDDFRDTPPDQLLTGLRGKKVIVAFIESYGRSAVQDPAMAPQVDKVLADRTKALRKAGFSSKSAFLTSPVAGAGSWLAHSTFLSGLWIDNQQRYRTLTSSDRLTLTGAFRRSKAWRTVGIMPGVTRAWPEGKFFGLDSIHDSRELGYKGPKFSWSPVPDQYSMSAFNRLEHGKHGPKPSMSEIILTSSHNPWAPIPKMIDWKKVGDGSEYKAIKKAGKRPTDVWKDPDQVRTEYRRSIEYSVRSLTGYMEKYADDDTVLVFLGDHQPHTIVTGDHATRDVPISIVAHDPKVFDRISDWGWEEGLKPGPKAPVWRMDSFRDRFLTAYGPRHGHAPASR